jgi:hypothetical protein
MIPILGDVIREVGGVVRELIPDADKRMDIDLKFAELADKASERETELLSGQIEVNKTEAASSNLFVAGWRPFIGWVSGSALAYTWIVAPIAKTLFHLTELPAIPTQEIYPIVLAMLGVAGMRTYEKVKGVSTGVLGRGQGIAEQPVQTEVPKQDSRSSKLHKWFK